MSDLKMPLTIGTLSKNIRSDWLIAGVAPLVQPLEVQKVPALSIDTALLTAAVLYNCADTPWV